MLALQYIRENEDDVLEGLKKRGFKNLKIINQIINLDSERRTKQAELDKHLAESNQMAKKIGKIFKAGEIKEANVLKEKSQVYKVKTKKPKQSKKISKKFKSTIPKKPDFLLKVVNFQNSLKPEFKFRLNFSFEKYIQAFFDKIADTISQL